MFTSFLLGVTSEEVFLYLHPKPNTTLSNEVLYMEVFALERDPMPGTTAFILCIVDFKVDILTAFKK